LAIAHRLDTIDDCDRIIVMDKGQIAEFDTPTNLKNVEGGIYASMFKAAGHAKTE
jgi:ABC-type multidrug transport system fused ATPase/permease subunit